MPCLSATVCKWRVLKRTVSAWSCSAGTQKLSHWDVDWLLNLHALQHLSVKVMAVHFLLQVWEDVKLEIHIFNNTGYKSSANVPGDDGNLDVGKRVAVTGTTSFPRHCIFKGGTIKAFIWIFTWQPQNPTTKPNLLQKSRSKWFMFCKISSAFAQFKKFFFATALQVAVPDFYLCSISIMAPHTLK